MGRTGIYFSPPARQHEAWILPSPSPFLPSPLFFIFLKMFSLSARAAALFSLALIAVKADPTIFTPDSRLHRSFWGIAYTYVHSARRL